MDEEIYIVRDIIECVAKQRGLLQAIGDMTRERAVTLEKIDGLSDQINLLEDRLWWLRFIRYCNTPCWKYS